MLTTNPNCLACGLFGPKSGPCSILNSSFSEKKASQNTILIVTSGPTWQEGHVGAIGCDESSGADILEDAARQFLQTKWAVIPAYRCHSQKIKPKQIALCKEAFYAPMIEDRNPRAIIACGTEALKVVLGGEKPNSSTAIETVGYVIKNPDGSDCQVFSLPAVSKFNDPKTDHKKLLSRYRTTFAKANDYAVKIDANEAPIPFTLLTSLSEGMRFASESFVEFAFDVENTHSSKDLSKNVIHKHAVKLLTLSITTFVDNQYHNYILAEKALDSQVLHKLFAGRTIIAHNIKHDAQVIRLKRSVDVLRICKDFHDTMVWLYLADQNRKRNGLKPLATHYLGCLDWGVKLKAFQVKAGEDLRREKLHLRKQISELEKINSTYTYEQATTWAAEGFKRVRKEIRLSYETLLALGSQQALLDRIASHAQHLDRLPEALDTENYELVPLEKLAEYNAEDTLRTYQLWREVFRSDDLYREYYDDEPGTQQLVDPECYQMVKNYIVALCDVEINGIPLDVEGLMAFDKTLEARIADLKEKLFAYDDVKLIISNITKVQECKLEGEDLDNFIIEKISPKTGEFVRSLMRRFGMLRHAKITKKTRELSFGDAQLKEVLKDLEGQGGRETHCAIVSQLLELRRSLDLRSKTTQSWVRFVCEDGKMHPTFKVVVNQNLGFANSEESGGAQSGRLGAADPNSQQFPKDFIDFVRQYMVAPEGFRFVEIDYASLEPMLIAVVTRCERLLDIFRQGKDIYLATADDILGLGLDWSRPLEDLKQEYKAIRNMFKVGFLAWCYGQSKRSFAKQVGISEEETDNFYAKALEFYREVYEWKEGIYHKVDTGQYITTLSGRRRRFPIPPVPGKNSSRDERDRYNMESSRAKRIAVNFEIQSLGNDITLSMLVKVNEWIRDNYLQNLIQIINAVHDSIWLQVHDSVIDKVPDICDIMTNMALLHFNVPIPLKVEETRGRNLGESMDPKAWRKYEQRRRAAA